MREMGPSFVTVAAQGFYRSRVRNCYPLPKKEDTLKSVSSFLSLRRRLHMLTFPCPVAVDSACAEVLPNTCRHTGAVMRFGGSVPGSGHMGPPFRRKRPMRLWLPSQEDSGDLSDFATVIQAMGMAIYPHGLYFCTGVIRPLNAADLRYRRQAGRRPGIGRLSACRPGSSRPS